MSPVPIMPISARQTDHFSGLSSLNPTAERPLKAHSNLWGRAGSDRSHPNQTDSVRHDAIRGRARFLGTFPNRTFVQIKAATRRGQSDLYSFRLTRNLNLTTENPDQIGIPQAFYYQFDNRSQTRLSIVLLNAQGNPISKTAETVRPQATGGGVPRIPAGTYYLKITPSISGKHLYTLTLGIAT